MSESHAVKCWSVIDTLRAKNISDDIIKKAILDLSRINPDPMAMVTAQRIVKEMHVTPVAGRIG